MDLAAHIVHLSPHLAQPTLRERPSARSTLHHPLLEALPQEALLFVQPYGLNAASPGVHLPRPVQLICDRTKPFSFLPFDLPAICNRICNLIIFAVRHHNALIMAKF